MSTREEFIAGLRDLADFLTVNPDVPTPCGATSIQISADGENDDERRAVVDRAALAMGVEPFDPYGRGEHWEARLRFGPVTFYALAIDDVHMADYREANRLGEAALAAKKAAAADVIAVEVAELSQADAVHGMFGGHMEWHGSHKIYVAPCGTEGPFRLTGIFSDITCGSCRKALIS